MKADRLSRKLEGKVARARAIAFWERFWPSCLRPLLCLGVLLALALFGLFELLPAWLHIAVLAVFAVAFVWLLRPAFRLRWPDRNAGLRRLEAGGELLHRPASSYADTLTAPAGDETAQSIWRAHKARLRARIANLRTGWPSSGLPRHDPYALRAALVLVLFVAFVRAGSDSGDRLRAAVVPTVADPAVKAVWIDAWVTPPPHTGRAPVFLASGKTAGNLKAAAGADRPVDIPVNSELVIRVTGARAPSVAVMPDNSPAAGAQKSAFGKAGGDVMELRRPIRSSGQAVVRDGIEDIAAWRFNVIPDLIPVIRLDGGAATSQNRTLRFKYSAEDDYGIVSAGAVFAPDPEAAGYDASKGDAKPLNVEAPDFPLVLPEARTRKARQTVYRDLTAHPWAGLGVLMTLRARDEAGQTGESGTVALKLPERVFTKPLARALIEQRRNLVRNTRSAPRVSRALNALMILPDKVIGDTSAYLGISTAYRMLKRSHDPESFTQIVDLLWDIALRVENGDLSLAERELRATQEALRKALAEGAPPEEIERLTGNLRKALDRFMKAMAEQAIRNARKNPQRTPPDPNARQIRPQDLERMMDMIENLARSGARDAAQEMLAQLNRILENLRAGTPQTGNPDRQSQLSKWLDQLGDLMGRQQELMDLTFQQSQGSRGNENRNGGQTGDGDLSLADRQRALRDMLDRLTDRFRQGGANAPSAFDRAGDAMGDATDELRNGRSGQATGPQGEALDQMRQGANAMARRMLEGMGQANQSGRRGQRAGQGEVDPLGRPLKSIGPDFGTSTRVPTDMEIQRAREIMRELQRRLGERTRPRIELDYLERLLRRF